MFLLNNPQSIAIKRYLFELLKERYSKNEKFIDRFSSTITSQQDYEDFGKLIVDIFEVGFLRAVNQYKEQFEKMGMKINIVPEEVAKNPKSKIFSQKNQAESQME